MAMSADDIEFLRGCEALPPEERLRRYKLASNALDLIDGIDRANLTNEIMLGWRKLVVESLERGTK